MPVVWADYGYGQTLDGVKILTKRSATTASTLYSKYLDEEALVWDSSKQELFVYVPDAECPAVAFKGSSWLCAKKIKTEAIIENQDLNIYEVYKEILSKIKG
jgi:hypothetical protein